PASDHRRRDPRSGRRPGADPPPAGGAPPREPRAGLRRALHRAASLRPAVPRVRRVGALRNAPRRAASRRAHLAPAPAAARLRGEPAGCPTGRRDRASSGLLLFDGPARIRSFGTRVLEGALRIGGPRLARPPRSPDRPLGELAAAVRPPGRRAL